MLILLLILFFFTGAPGASGGTFISGIQVPGVHVSRYSGLRELGSNFIISLIIKTRNGVRDLSF